MNNTHLLACDSPALLSEGTIYIFRNLMPVFFLMNFTECSLTLDNADRGIGVLARFMDKLDYEWTFRYCTVLRCIGSTGIHHGINKVGTVESCNFYHNIPHSERGFLYSRRGGFRIANCVFNNQTGRDIFLYEPSDSRFVLVNCVFSSDLLPAVYFSGATSGNIFNSVTGSIRIEHFNTMYCPTASPSQSPTALFSHSSQFFPSARLVQQHLPNPPIRRVHPRDGLIR
jgi:hypothetical protein